MNRSRLFAGVVVVSILAVSPASAGGYPTPRLGSILLFGARVRRLDVDLSGCLRLCEPIPHFTRCALGGAHARPAVTTANATGREGIAARLRDRPDGGGDTLLDRGQGDAADGSLPGWLLERDRARRDARRERANTDAATQPGRHAGAAAHVHVAHRSACREGGACRGG